MPTSIQRIIGPGDNSPGGTLGQPQITADGRFAVFASHGRNLVADDTNALRDIFVFDRQTGAVERASVAGAGIQTNGESVSPATSGDGRFAAFQKPSFEPCGG